MNARILTASLGEAKFFCSRLIIMRKSVRYFSFSWLFERLRVSVNTRIVLDWGRVSLQCDARKTNSSFMGIKMKKIIVVVGFIVSAWIMMQATLAQAEVIVNVVVDVAPPALPYEEVPAPRYGYLWVSGYWDWSGSEYSWREGYWLAERIGFVYQTPYWYSGSGGWYRRPGGWHNRPDHPHNNVSEQRSTNWSYDWQHRQPRYETGRATPQNYDRNRDDGRHDARSQRRDQNSRYDRQFDRLSQPAPESANPRAPQPRIGDVQRNGRDNSSNRNGDSSRRQESQPSSGGDR